MSLADDAPLLVLLILPQEITRSRARAPLFTWVCSAWQRAMIALSALAGAEGFCGL